MKIAATDVINLLHSADHATLATHSQQMPGYPYATVVPCIVGEAHRPIFLLSLLAEHTKNLLADGRCSLSVVQIDAGNVQTAARLSIVGDCERFEPTPELVARYLRYQPDAEQYLALDFVFLRMLPKRARFIGGVGHMGWLESEDWHGFAQVKLEDEADLLASLATPLSGDVQLLGVDCYGIDCLVGGQRIRKAFASTATSGDEVCALALRALQAAHT
jgi:heme iron utilization protein